MNQMVAHVMSGVTCPFRFPGQLNTDMRKQCVNLIPFPRLHFFINSYAPLTGRNHPVGEDLSAHQLVSSMLNPRNMMVSIDPTEGRYMTASAVFRGKNISTS